MKIGNLIFKNSISEKKVNYISHLKFHHNFSDEQILSVSDYSEYLDVERTKEYANLNARYYELENKISEMFILLMQTNFDKLIDQQRDLLRKESLNLLMQIVKFN